MKELRERWVVEGWGWVEEIVTRFEFWLQQMCSLRLL